ncbi:hypothetical protein [Mammaliicoccus sciuri]|uniref:hypothetical protein n=1 Tax=Mammaliicoccus sciuri TaxID=1296 RepID=UPI001AAE536F|nr:hypothetical protein [Mammaliicoccus sciuri]MBO3081161.1 hypothetical protein [Mammaliicoccus sciuri]
MFKKSKLSQEEKEELKVKKQKSKQEKVKTKQRIKNKKQNKKTAKEYYILGGKWGDRDPRTKDGIRTLRLRRISRILLLISVVYFIYMYAELTDYKTNNTTPIGKELTFSKSEASIKIADIWSDKNREVTVVKFRYSGKARDILSLDGKNYNLYFIHNRNHKPKVEMKYGVLGTEGDGYLFIKGKLDRRAYQILIANTLDLYNGSSNNSSLNSLKGKSVEKALTQTDIDTMDEDGVLFKKLPLIGGGKDKTPKFDNLNFRLNAYSENTKIYNGSFLDNNGNIDYGKVISKTSVSEVKDKIDNTIKQKNQERQSLTVSLEEYKNRLKRNKDDKDSRTSIDKINEKIKKTDEELELLEKEKERYEKATFSKKDFGDMQEKFEYYEL